MLAHIQWNRAPKLHAAVLVEAVLWRTAVAALACALLELVPNKAICSTPVIA